MDSSVGYEKESILFSCEKYDAIYVEGDDSVRKKRNKGIQLAKYDYILFIDSDVVVKNGLLDEYVKAYQNPYKVRLGGVLGYTEFVGKKTFWWKMLERTSLINSFSFARDYPFHSWTIGNNVSFKKSVLEEIGMFEENFPFKLGGDDLDMTYRVTKAGYMIGSAPDAVTYHSRKTWNNYKAVHDRAKRWGTMENFIVDINCPIPSPENIVDTITKVPVTVIATRPSIASGVAYNPVIQQMAQKSHVKKLLMGGGFLSKERRHLLEEVWDAECFNMFGMSEVFGPMAGECRQKNGLHYLNNYLMIEIVDPQNGKPVGNGEPGVAVYTTLWDKGFPLLRYSQFYPDCAWFSLIYVGQLS